ncbi:MAG: flavin reductase family protein [Firmicutes bacterium]|nr:flavin reductase family protein [Bacillota bacterium]
MKKQIGPGTYVFPTPTYIIGTYNEDGTADVMNLAWGGVCGFKPPCVQISLNTGRRTRENLLRTGCFTVNIGGVNLMAESDYFGLISGSKANKLETVGFTSTRSENVDAPVIDQYPLTLECRMVDSREIGPHLMVIGEIVGVVCDEDVLDDKGKPDVKKIKPLGLDPIGHNYIAFDHIVGEAYKEGRKYLNK